MRDLLEAAKVLGTTRFSVGNRERWWAIPYPERHYAFCPWHFLEKCQNSIYRCRQDAHPSPCQITSPSALLREIISNLHSTQQKPQTPLLLKISKHIYPNSLDNSKPAINWRNSRPLISVEAQEHNHLPESRGCGSYTPGPAHHPSHNPLGKGRGQPPEDMKAAGGAAGSFLICLKSTACKALNRESNSYWKR